MADGSRLRPPGERRRLLRSLSDGSHPSVTSEHGSEPSVPPMIQPAPPLRAATFVHSLVLPDRSAARALLTACPSFLPGFGTNVTQFVEREEGGGNRQTFKHFNDQINKHKSKAAAPHGRLPQTKRKIKSRPGPLSSYTVVAPPFILPELLRGTRDR
ncbi:hypothetical protein M9458_052024, partial [Cirrhinus mrigala]